MKTRLLVVNISGIFLAMFLSNLLAVATTPATALLSDRRMSNSREFYARFASHPPCLLCDKKCSVDVATLLCNVVLMQLETHGLLASERLLSSTHLPQ
jgi:hypothetical protein